MPGPEAVDRRTVDSRHFDLGGGRFQARISMAPLHYLDEDGGWKDIDTTLIPRGEIGPWPKRTVCESIYRLYSGAELEVHRRPQSIDERESSRAVGGGGWTARLTPIGIRSVNGDVHHDLALVEDRSQGSVAGGLLDFGEVASGVSASYRVVPNGLGIHPTVSENPEGLAFLDSGRFESVWALDLPNGVTLRPVAGAFTRGEAVEVVDRDGRQLLVIAAPEVCERDRPHEKVRGALTVIWWPPDHSWSSQSPRRG